MLETGGILQRGAIQPDPSVCPSTSRGFHELHSSSLQGTTTLLNDGELTVDANKQQRTSAEVKVEEIQEKTGPIFTPPSDSANDYERYLTNADPSKGSPRYSLLYPRQTLEEILFSERNDNDATARREHPYSTDPRTPTAPAHRYGRHPGRKRHLRRLRRPRESQRSAFLEACARELKRRGHFTSQRRRIQGTRKQPRGSRTNREPMEPQHAFDPNRVGQGAAPNAPPAAAYHVPPAGGAPAAGADAAGGLPPPGQGPRPDWTPEQWLQYILERSNALDDAIQSIRGELAMSDARADATNQAARNIVRELADRMQSQNTAKPAHPDTFHGRTSEDVTQWLFTMEQYFLASRVVDEVQKINYAASLLRGSASLWWRQTVEDRGRPATWRNFSEALRFQFVTTNTSVETRYHLSNLQQRRGFGVTEYAQQCVILCLRLRDMSEADKIFYFVMGLRRPEVRRDALSRNPTTLADAIRYAEISDSSLYPGGSHRIGHLYGHRPNFTPQNNRHRPPSPMDLDAMGAGNSGYPHRTVFRNTWMSRRQRPSNNSRTFSKSERIPRQGDNRSASTSKSNHHTAKNGFRQGERTSRKGKCFKCGRLGHYARSCRQPHSNFAVEIDDCECCTGEVWDRTGSEEPWSGEEDAAQERPSTGEAYSRCSQDCQGNLCLDQCHLN